MREEEPSRLELDFRNAGDRFYSGCLIKGLVLTVMGYVVFSGVKCDTGRKVNLCPQAEDEPCSSFDSVSSNPIVKSQGFVDNNTAEPYEVERNYLESDYNK